VNAALGETQEALKGTDHEAIKSSMEKLATESQKMGSALYSQPGAEGAAGAAGGAADGAASDAQDDVVDAEIVDDDKDAKGDK